MRSRWIILSLLGLLLSRPAVRAEVKLPALFSNHMVLQQQTPLPIWGWADPGEKVTVTLAGQSKSTTADKEGKWSVKLDKLQPGQPLTLTVAGKNKLTVTDVLVGEVWLASGQSNMAMTVARSKNAEQEKAAAKYPQIRMFFVRSGAATTPQADCKGEWVVCSPETVGLFSAAAYFFGREVHKDLQVPVGLINSSVGGTAIEAWTSSEAQKEKKELASVFAEWDRKAKNYDPVKAKAQYDKQLDRWKRDAADAKAAGKPAPRRPQLPVAPREDRNHPANLFNGKIAPLIPYALRGALWYQGENNTRPETAALYGIQLPLLIQDWRSRWGQGEFPFVYVQLPNFSAPANRGWPLVREGMLHTLKVPNTGMAITIDIGDPKDIHPTNKQEVGHRLALWALSQVYGRKGSSSGPLLKSQKIGAGKITLVFDHADEGLKAKGSALTGFLVAGEDGKWRPATARIENSNTVIVSSPEVQMPVAVRYLWENNPTASLYNGAGLPASPFRTDRERSDLPKR